MWVIRQQDQVSHTQRYQHQDCTLLIKLYRHEMGEQRAKNTIIKPLWLESLARNSAKTATKRFQNGPVIAVYMRAIPQSFVVWYCCDARIVSIYPDYQYMQHTSHAWDIETRSYATIYRYIRFHSNQRVLYISCTSLLISQALGTSLSLCLP